ncbi:hypothetical protein L1987_46289 [Smallanthus sonchifolius]|uniref:Uncharacterized protein n=1 Tax=Smallanthus sonchifolius TaxID=185202 RepID=A0ACB9FZ17_9ASTR|nr:hypothetical protein L1987_46289 [Smallanthus sonchifolius]
MKCFSRFTNDESDPIIIEIEETDSECEKDHSKEKKQQKEKKNKEADEGKRSGKKLESVKKGKRKEKVEEGLQLKVDSGKERKEPEQGQGQGQGKITDCKKRKTSTSETMQKHIPFTGKKLLLRCAPGNLINLLHNLTKSQRKVVEEIGFGKTLLLKLHMIPTSLGYWLLQNYDPSTDILNDGANEYKLTTSLINEIFGIPNGETQVTQMSKQKTYDPVVKEWRSQFDDEMQKKQKKIYVSDLVDYLKKTDDSGRMFKLNFMVVLMSIIGETMKSNTVRMERIEKELKKVEEHVEKLKMLFEKERKDYPSKETPRIQSKDIVLLDTPLIVSQDTMSELIELEKQATKRIEEVENQKKKSESINKNDPPSFRLLSQDSNEGNPEIEIGNTENVEKETIGEKEIVEEMVGEKPVGGTEKIGEELVVEKNVGKKMVVEKNCWKTLSTGIEVHVDVINTWAHLLNKEELKRNRDSSVFRLFCTAPMIKEAFVSFIVEFAHPKTDEMDDTVVKRFEMPWRTTVNNKDCGIFMMTHMETYMGEEEKAWQCGFGVESENVQEKQIEYLRRKYCAKIMLHEINELKHYIVEEMKKYLQISYPSRKILEETSKKRIEERLNRELD